MCLVVQERITKAVDIGRVSRSSSLPPPFGALLLESIIAGDSAGRQRSLQSWSWTWLACFLRAFDAYGPVDGERASERVVELSSS